eukprot:TRINITY_DN3198_c0_g1_i4.p1 TRINITY_DN3198_c0_g1~~TRINITY_DN3198_c0_g1_i4.p1  ORF type:complete len:587 (-),score=142.77 TRINITY_DN3198_c0_g1_i4:693-2453(-)
MGKKVFSGCHFCITGKLSQLRKLVVNHIESNGGVVHSSVTSDVGYLICSESDIGTSKYMTAQGFGVKLIKEQYLYDCVAKGKLLDTAKYDIEGDGSGGSDDDDADPPAKAAPKKASKLKAWDNPPAPAAKKAKKNASEDEDGDDDDGDDAMDASEEESEDDSDDRPVCSFGATCYRKNPQHFIDESHPKDHASYVAPPKKPKAPKAPKPKTAPTAKAAATAKTAPPAVTKTASSAVKVLASADLLGEIQQHLPNKDVLNLALTNTDVASLVASALKTRQADFELGEPLRHLKAKEYAQDVLSLNTSEDVFLKGDIIKMDDERYEVLQAPEDGGWKLKNLSTGKITKAKEDDDDFSDKMYSADLEESKPANAMQEKHRNKLPVEIWYTDNGVYFHDELQQLVNALAESKAPDWHPGSKEIVNDLVHPALYALKLPKAPQGEDFWRRPFDNSVHQWLPSEIDVDKFGRVRFASYINNMPPGQEHLTVVLERLLELLIPSWEHAWQYCRTYMQGNTADGDMQEEYQDEELVSFRGRRLQVVPKIVEFVLKPGQTYEAMPVCFRFAFAIVCNVARSPYRCRNETLCFASQ